MPHRLTFALVSFLALALALPGQAATLYVSKTGDASDGLSWPTAYTAIGDAIAASATGDEIWVKEDEYRESLEPKVPLKMFGGFNGAETKPDEREGMDRRTTIRGEGSGALVFNHLISTRSDLLVDGFHLRSGVHDEGGGFHVIGATIEIRNCFLTGNGLSGNQGGGLSARGGGIFCASSTMKIMDSTFWLNHQYAETRVEGGGIYACDHSTLVVDRCLFYGNGGTVLAYGETDPIFGTGGGIQICGGSEAIIRNCVFRWNRTYVADCNLCTFILNSGNAIYVESSEATLEHCTFAGNPPDRPIGSAIFGWLNAEITITNSIMAEQDALESRHNISYGAAIPVVSHSTVMGGYPGTGNIDAAPLFVNPEYDDFHLQYGSPCIDSGTIVETLADLDGNVRPVDIPGVGVDGPGAFDMGAYEYQFPQSDLSRNGYMDPMDLFILGSDWMKASDASKR